MFISYLTISIIVPNVLLHPLSFLFSLSLCPSSSSAASKIKLKGEEDSSDSDSDSDTSESNFDISNKKPISKNKKKKYDPTQILYGRFVSGGLLVDENSTKLQQIAAEDPTLTSNASSTASALACVVSTPADSKSTSPVVSSDDSSDDEEDLMKLYAAAGLPEEELLRRCGGRTAHKGNFHFNSHVHVKQEKKNKK